MFWKDDFTLKKSFTDHHSFINIVSSTDQHLLEAKLKRMLLGKHHSVDHVLLENAPSLPRRFSSSPSSSSSNNHRHHHDETTIIIIKQPLCAGLGDGWGMKPSLGRPEVSAPKIVQQNMCAPKKITSQKPQIQIYHH